MGDQSAPGSGPGTSPDTPATAFLSFYDEALPHVYGYLSARCGQVVLAEDLTAETFLAAVDAVRRAPPGTVSIPWVIAVARHKLVDHWRRQARDERRLRLMAASEPLAEDPWEAHLEADVALETLHALPPQYRAALTLRYLDDLPVAQVAALLGRSLHATEALLVRARVSFRHAYEDGEAHG